jgi:hypothetical protein
MADAWQQVQQDRLGNSLDDLSKFNMRLVALHCHWTEASIRLAGIIIKGTIPAHAS